MSTTDILLIIMNFAGALAVFLYAMKLMSEGLQKAAGSRMRAVLAKITDRPLNGILTGMAVTAAIQSSSATTVMVVGFVSAGLLSLRGAVAVIMGANIGTTVTAWIITLLGLVERMGSMLRIADNPESSGDSVWQIGLTDGPIREAGRLRDQRQRSHRQQTETPIITHKKANRMKKNIMLSVAVLAVMGLSACNEEEKRVIEFDALPEAAQTFVQTHFADKQVAIVYHDRDAADKDYEVVFTDGANIDFTRKGEWDEAEDRDADGLPTAFMPQSIVDYAADKHPGQNIVQIDRGRKGYEVELSSGIELVFDKNGAFVRYDD